jgi:hypothetical protein
MSAQNIRKERFERSLERCMAVLLERSNQRTISYQRFHQSSTVWLPKVRMEGGALSPCPIAEEGLVWFGLTLVDSTNDVGRLDEGEEREGGRAMNPEQGLACTTRFL